MCRVTLLTLVLHSLPFAVCLRHEKQQSAQFIAKKRSECSEESVDNIQA